MTLRLLVQCDGTPADRPGMALESCRAFYPTTAGDRTNAVGQAAAFGGYVQRPDGRHLCPDCARGAALIERTTAP